MIRRKRDGNHSTPKNNLIQDSEGNEENGYQVLDSNKTMIKHGKEPNYVHKNNLKEEILQVITENFLEMLLHMVNQNVQEALKKFQDTKNKEYEKTQKQIDEVIGALSKHESETQNTITRKQKIESETQNTMNELKMKINKEEVIHDMENHRKKKETETQNSMGGHSSRLEQVEDRISELEDKMEIKGKTEDLLVQQLKNCKRNMQELTDFIKRPNLRIWALKKEKRSNEKGFIMYSIK
jgi:chromosome segregation ATPase